MSNSIIIVAWPLNGPRVEQPPSISNILQGDSSCLFLSPPPSSYYPPLLPLLPSFAPPIANSFQSSFMPPGGEDLITRGEWIPLPSLSARLSNPLSFPRSRHRLPLHFSLFIPFLSSFSFSSFSKVAVSRKPAARSLGFRGLVFFARITKRFLGPEKGFWEDYNTREGRKMLLTGCVVTANSRRRISFSSQNLLFQESSNFKFDFEEGSLTFYPLKSTTILNY